MLENSHKVIEHLEKKIKRKQQDFKEAQDIINQLQQKFIYGNELLKIEELQEIAGIGYIKKERDAAPRRGFNTKQRLSYFLISNIKQQGNQQTITYDTTLEAIMKQHEDYKYRVKGRLGFIGIGKEAGYEQITKLKEIIIEQEKITKPSTITTYVQPQSKIYILNNEELQRIQNLLKK